MPGSIRAIRRAADPIRGRGRIPIAKRKDKGHPEFRDAGKDAVSDEERAIARVVMDAVAQISHEALVDAVQTGDVVGYASIVRETLVEQSGAIEAALFDAFVVSGDAAAIEIGTDLARAYRQVGKANAPLPSEVAMRFRFDRTDPRAVDWVRRESGSLITNMVRSEQEAIRTIIESSFTQQGTYQRAASGIYRQLSTVSPSLATRDFANALGTNLNGLTARYEQAVINRVSTVADDLAARGITGTKALSRMRQEGDKYAQRLRRSRSRTIARTERLRAHNEARLLSMQQAIDSGLASREHSRKQWQTGPFDVCNICVPMQGQQMKVADSFTLPNGSMVQAPPAHPNCRCSMTMVTDVRLYNPPETLGTGEIGDPFRVGGRGFNLAGRQLSQRPVTAPIGADTQQMFTTTVNGQTRYTPERIRQVHDPFIRENLRDGISYGDDQVVTFMGGGPASGKGSIQQTGQLTFRKGTVVVDPDEAKLIIPEYAEQVAVGNKRAAQYVHEESSDLAKRLMAESIDNGFDTVLDGTGDSGYEKFAGKVQKARQQGANRVVAEYVTVDTDEAVRRAIKRGQETGRDVPEDVIRKTHEQVSRVFPEAAEKNLFDELRLYDTNGDTPVLIYEKIDGAEKILDPVKYDNFLRKNPDYTPTQPRLGTAPSTADDLVYGVNDTQGLFTEVVDGQTKYLDDRIRDVHDPFIQKALRDGAAVEEPTMTFMGGGSGAGKGTLQREGILDFDGRIVIDADKAKEAIPEYRLLVDEDNPIAAAFVHEESSDMAVRLTAEALDNNFNTVLDGTGDSSIEKLAGKVESARQQGAKKVVAEYVTIDTDEALKRAAERAARSGREVPEDVIRGTHSSVSRIFPEAAERNLFDELRLWDNSGKPPELIYEKKNGVERILNPERYRAFLEKNPDYKPPADPARIKNLDDLRKRTAPIRNMENTGLRQINPILKQLDLHDGTSNLNYLGDKPAEIAYRASDDLLRAKFSNHARGLIDLNLTETGLDVANAIDDAGKQAYKYLDDALRTVREGEKGKQWQTLQTQILDARDEITAGIQRPVNEIAQQRLDTFYKLADELEFIDPASSQRLRAVLDDGSWRELMDGYTGAGKVKFVRTTDEFDELLGDVLKRNNKNERVKDWMVAQYEGTPIADVIEREWKKTGAIPDDHAEVFSVRSHKTVWMLKERAGINVAARREVDLQDNLRRWQRDLQRLGEELLVEREQVIREFLRSNISGFGRGDSMRVLRRGTNGIQPQQGISVDDVVEALGDYSGRVPQSFIDDAVDQVNTLWSVPRGYYSEFKEEIGISSGHLGGWIQTLTHELTHLHQHKSSRITAAERLWLSKRTRELTDAGNDNWFVPKQYKGDDEPFFDLGFGNDYSTKLYFGGGYGGPTEVSSTASEFLWFTDTIETQRNPLVMTEDKRNRALVEFWLGVLLTLS